MHVSTSDLEIIFCLMCKLNTLPFIGWAKFRLKLSTWTTFWAKLVILDRQKMLFCTTH